MGGQQVATEKGKSQHYMRKPEPVWLDHLDKRGSDAASKEREADMPKAPKGSLRLASSLSDVEDANWCLWSCRLCSQ